MAKELSVVGTALLAKTICELEELLSVSANTNSAQLMGVVCFAYHRAVAALDDSSNSVDAGMRRCRTMSGLAVAAMHAAIVLGSTSFDGMLQNPDSMFAEMAKDIQQIISEMKKSQEN